MLGRGDAREKDQTEDKNVLKKEKKLSSLPHNKHYQNNKYPKNKMKQKNIEKYSKIKKNRKGHLESVYNQLQ